MDKKPLIGVSILAVVLLVLGSLSNVVESERTESCGCGDPPCWPILSGEMGDNNWYVSWVSVELNGTYNYIYYRINGSNWITYVKPFTMKTQGIHLLEWTCDSNLSNISSIEIKIDWEPPILSNYTKERIGLFKWQFSIDAIDNYSGVNKVWCWYGGYGHEYDTEQPYQFVFHGCLWLLNLIITILIPWELYCTANAWDNAGNVWPMPS